MQKTFKRTISILLSILMIVSVFAVVPFTASALTIDDVQSLLSSMEAKMNDYYAQGDWDRAGALKDYYDWLDEELEYAEGQITPELENAYNESYEYFMANSGSGVSYPDVNNVYWATNGWVNVTVSDLQPGDVLGSSSDYLSVRKGDCDIVLVGGTYCEGGSLNQTYPNNVTLGNDIEFHFSDNFVRIIDGDNAKNYSPVYNNALGNAYMVIGKENGTVYLAGYYFTTYTVTWKNEDGTTLETDTDVEEGATPTYDGETPTKADGECCTYTFSGWTDGTNTYAANELPTVAADVTYTATFTSAVISERAADLVEITDHETELADLGLDDDMSEWGRSMTAQEAITLAQYMSAQNDGAKCAVLYEVVDDYELQYAMSDGTTGSRADFYYSSLNEFLPDYKVYYLPVNLNPQTIELNLNPDNATVNWDDSTGEYGYWAIDAIYDGKRLTLCGENQEQAAGTYEWADMKEAGTPGITDTETYKTIVRFINGSCTVTVDEDVVTVSGTFTGVDRNTYVVTVTHEAPYYTITDESVNGAVTAGVNGADVTRAKAGKTVLLNVAPADGYRFKSITASAPKDEAENFSDLVALMGDTVFDGNESYDCGGYTCKVENGKFVVYNGTTFVTELSESNMTEFTPDPVHVQASSDTADWIFFISDGKLEGISVLKGLNDYIYKSAYDSVATGSLPLAELALTTVAEGSQYSFTMPAKNITVKAEFEAIPTHTVTWKNGDTVLETDTDVAEGTTPTYDGATPYKADGADCIYTFSGWTPEVSAVTGNVTYTAQFTESEKPETIKNCNNKYGDFRLYSNVPIVSFSNVNDLLTGAIIPITYGDSNTMIPVQDAKGYSYKFYDQTGTEIPTQITDSSSAPGSKYGFSDDVTVYTNVISFTRPAGCTAIYIVATAPAPTYTVTWKNWDGSVLATDTVTEGNAPVYSGATPAKEKDNYHSYYFTGWTDGENNYGASDTLPVVSGDVTYTAQFVVFTNEFTVFAKTVTGKTITVRVTGDTTVAQVKDMLVNEMGIPAAQLRLIFAGDEMENEKTLAYYKLQKESTIHVVAKTYTVTWKNWDGTELASEQVSYGATPIYDDQDPVKPDDELYKYTFTGWAPDVTAVTGDAEYTAQFDREDRGEIIDGKYYVDGVLKKSLGLIYLDGEYYYVMVTGEIYKNNSLSLAESKANGYIPQGRYYFDNEGKMSYKNGIVAGYYYVNDELQKGAGLVKIGNDFYFVKQNGAVYKDASLYVAEAKTNGLMPAGKYFFDENGKMEVKNGVYGGFYYENNEIVKGKGIVEFENDLYFVKQNGAVYTTHHLMVPEAKTNGLIAPGLYDFEDDGRLIR